MAKETVRAYRSYDYEKVSDDTGLRCTDVSRTRQDQKDEADINVIVELFGITGKLPENARLPSYGDFTGVDDYRSAIEAVRSAEANFMSYPASIRGQFDNDPQLFLEFVTDPNNLPKLREMGLARPSPDVPVPVPELPAT